MRSFCVNRNRNSIPVLVYKPGQGWSVRWFMLVYRSGNPTTRRKSLGDTTTNKWVGSFFFFFTLKHRRFRSFPYLRDQSENNFLGARFHRSATAATESTTNSSSSSSVPHLSHHFPFEKDACQTAAAFHFLMVSMKTSSRTDEKEQRR